jgi:hypothetical protein
MKPKRNTYRSGHPLLVQPEPSREELEERKKAFLALPTCRRYNSEQRKRMRAEREERRKTEMANLKQRALVAEAELARLKPRSIDPKESKRLKSERLINAAIVRAKQSKVTE